MTTPYLIQRGTIEDDSNTKGLDSIVSLDYMGSAEFEFGALPKSLGRIRDNIAKYKYVTYTIGNKSITIFHNEQFNNVEIRDYLIALSNDQIRLKERSDFNTYINPSKHDLEWQSRHPHSTNFWWDIENDIMFWKENEIFTNHFNLIIRVKPI